MKKIFLCSLLLPCVAQAMEVTIPSENMLRDRLTNNGFELFVNNSNIVSALGGKTLKPSEVLKTTQKELRYFFQLVNNLKATEIISKETKLMAAIFADAPEALQALKDTKNAQYLHY